MSYGARARSSSRTYRWIEDQQLHPPDRTRLNETPEHRPAPQPYHAYPQMSAPSLLKGAQHTAAAPVEGFVFVNYESNQRVLPRTQDAKVTQVRCARPT